MLYVTQCSNGGSFSTWTSENRETLIKELNHRLMGNWDEDDPYYIFQRRNEYVEIMFDLDQLNNESDNDIEIHIMPLHNEYAYYTPHDGGVQVKSYKTIEDVEKAEYAYWLRCYGETLSGLGVTSNERIAAKEIRARVIYDTSYYYVLDSLGIDRDILKEGN